MQALHPLSCNSAGSHGGWLIRITKDFLNLYSAQKRTKGLIGVWGQGFISVHCTSKMQEAMEANRESLLSTPSGLFFSKDSSLLSDYLQQHAQKAGKRTIHHNTPSIRSPSKRLFRASTQREETEASEPSWFSGLKETSSSGNSMPGPSFTTVKGSSESFIARECSSQTLSELDFDRGDSGFMYRTTLSSLSGIESIECDESCAEATTRIHTNRDSLSLSRLSDELKEVNALADYHGRVFTNNKQPLLTFDQRSATHNIVNVNARVPANSKQASHLGDFSKNLMPSNYSVSSNRMTGFDLLVNAAMQVEFLDNQDMQTSNAPFLPAKKTDVAGNACNCEMRYACPLQLNSPILKKRVVRRARNAFSKRTGKDLLNRLGISSPATNTTKKLISVAEKDGNCINPMNSTHMQQQRSAIQYVRRKSSKTLAERVTSCDSSVLDATHDGSKNLSNKEDLQISLTGASDVCKQKVKGVQTEKQHTLKQQKRMHDLPKAQPVDPATKPFGNAMKVFCENHEDVVGKEKAASFSERINCGGEETTPEAEEETVACFKFGGSGIRVKIRPVRLPSQAPREVDDTTGSRITQRRERLWEHAEISKSMTHSTKVMIHYSSDNEQLQSSESDLLIGCTLVSSQESNKLEISEHVIQNTITTRKRKQLPIEEEHMGERDSKSKSTESLQSNFSNNPSSNPIVRSKRGRSQVLPSKFADSVLQPWKRAYRKRS